MSIDTSEDTFKANTVEEAVARARQLPQPSGYHILCMVPPAEETFKDSTLLKPDTVVRTEELTTVVLFVVALGPDCFRDATRFPSGPWCKKGDFILARTYAGTRLRIQGREFRIINDDSVEAIVEDPRGIYRM